MASTGATPNLSPKPDVQSFPWTCGTSERERPAQVGRTHAQHHKHVTTHHPHTHDARDNAQRITTALHGASMSSIWLRSPRLARYVTCIPDIHAASTARKTKIVVGVAVARYVRISHFTVVELEGCELVELPTLGNSSNSTMDHIQYAWKLINSKKMKYNN